VLGGLPARSPAAIAIAQHRSADSPEPALADRLAALSALPVTEPSDKDPILPGQAYVAPADYHLLVESGSFALSTDERVQHSRPSIDVLFESAADAYGSRLIGVVLTGASEDGAAGLARVRERGGLTIVQDPETAQRRTMPEAAIAAGAAQGVLPLAEIAPLLVELCAAGLGKWSAA
jgi:two-component system, chemotaxis family, protein-glutamate methylesterase/glutaminase